MSSKTKIFVIRTKELIYTIVFVALLILGILRSPLGEMDTVPTFGPSGRQERLNC